MERFGNRLIKRFVDILDYEHMEDSIIEVLHAVVLMTNLED